LFQIQQIQLPPEMKSTFSSESPLPPLSAELSPRNVKDLYTKLLSSHLFSMEKSMLASLSSMEQKLNEKLEHCFSSISPNNDLLERNDILLQKSIDKAANTFLDKINECVVGENLINEIKKCITISDDLFQVKNQYVRDNIVDLDMKVSEQMSSKQIDHSRNHDKIVRSITDLSFTVKENAAKQTALYKEIKGHIGVLAGAVRNSDPYITGYPPELAGQAPKPKVPGGRPGPFNSRCEPLSPEEQEEMPPELQEGDNSGQPPVPPEAPSAHFAPENHVPEQRGSIENSMELSQLWKAIPRTTDWETFSGEGEYEHDLFIKQVDLNAQDYFMKDYMIVSSLGILLTKTAKNW
jgi:hypothetical protein